LFAPMSALPAVASKSAPSPAASASNPPLNPLPTASSKALSFRPEWAGIFLRAVLARLPTQRRNLSSVDHDFVRSSAGHDISCPLRWAAARTCPPQPTRQD